MVIYIKDIVLCRSIRVSWSSLFLKDADWVPEKYKDVKLSREIKLITICVIFKVIVNRQKRMNLGKQVIREVVEKSCMLIECS